MAGGQVAVQVTGLAGQRGQRLLFEGLSFRVESSGALVLRGSNGAGKTSLLRMLAGLIPPERGTVRLEGWAREAGDVRYLGHEDFVRPRVRVAEDLAFWRRISVLLGEGHGRATWPVAGADEALARMGARLLAQREGRTLSAGQRRRVALARLGFAPRGALWLLDEPLTGLDRAGRALLADLVEEHRRAGGAVILSAHEDFRAEGVQQIDLADFRVGTQGH